MAVKGPVYLDHQATTPLDPRVMETLNRVQRDVFGNPASSNHSFGWAAEAEVEKARGHVAALIGADPREIIFTSGATESNSLALLGYAWQGRPARLVTTVLEHSSILETARRLETEGIEVERLGCDARGVVDPLEVVRAIAPGAGLVTVTAAQNEIGTLQPLTDIAEICRGGGVPLHTDAAQGAVFAGLDVGRQALDLVSLSSHKIYGPKGVGALYVRRHHPPLDLNARQLGGGQEQGLRPGTLNVPAIAGFGEACRIAAERRDEDRDHLRNLSLRLLEGLRRDLDGVRLNGDPDKRLPGCLNLRFDGILVSRLLPRLTTVALSAGAACRTGQEGPSPVLLALGLSQEEALASLRIGLGRFTTVEEIDFAVEKIVAAVRKERSR